MIRQTKYKAGDFDNHGLLKVPWLFWCGVVLEVRGWWLTGLGILTEHGGHWLSWWYPDMVLQLTGLAAGLPALAMLFLYPVRDSLSWLAGRTYLLMLIAPVVMSAGDIGFMVNVRVQVTDTGWLALSADLVCLVSLWPDSRLRQVFFRSGEGG